MKTEIFLNPVSFLEKAKKYLISDEIKHGLMFSIAESLVKNPYKYSHEDPWFFIAYDSDEIQAAFIRTPPYNLIVSYFRGDLERISAAVCDAVEMHYGSIPGMVGESSAVKYLADKYCIRTGKRISKVMNQRIYKLEKLNTLEMPQGRFRKAEERDRDILSRWCIAFAREATGKDESEDKAINMIRSGSLFVWETDTVVTMAAKCRPLLSGVSISEVYTPPENRKKGYATACVHHLSRHILDSGYKYCTLYTDLSNPVSNSIYQKIGFNAMHDSIQIEFE